MVFPIIFPTRLGDPWSRLDGSHQAVVAAGPLPLRRSSSPGFGEFMGKEWQNDGNMVGNWWENDGTNDGKMMGKWFEHGGKLVGPWWENDLKMVGKWFEHGEKNGGTMMGKWLENGGKMIGKWWNKWWENGRSDPRNVLQIGSSKPCACAGIPRWSADWRSWRWSDYHGISTSWWTASYSTGWRHPHILFLGSSAHSKHHLPQTVIFLFLHFQWHPLAVW